MKILFVHIIHRASWCLSHIKRNMYDICNILKLKFGCFVCHFHAYVCACIFKCRTCNCKMLIAYILQRSYSFSITNKIQSMNEWRKLIFSQEYLIQLHTQTKHTKNWTKMSNDKQTTLIYFILSDSMWFYFNEKLCFDAFILNCDHHCFKIHSSQNLQITFKIQWKILHEIRCCYASK